LALSYFARKTDLSWVSRKRSLNGAKTLSRNKRKKTPHIFQQKGGKEEEKASNSQVPLKVQALCL